jgi:hypothetical protein
MSFSMLFYLLSCVGFYKLGGFTERNPGQLWEWAKQLRVWMDK